MRRPARLSRHAHGRPLAGAPGAAARLRPLFLLPLLLGALLTGCINEQAEQEIGDMVAADVNQQVPLVRDPMLNRYVTQLGLRLARASDRPDLPYRFYIIDSDMVNAFALPGGHIYLTRGLIEQTTTGAEMAAVLAHEIGHVAARHGVEKLQRHLRTGSLVSMLYELLLGGEPELLRRNALQMGSILWSARHSREDEREADQLAVGYLMEAGIDPDGIVRLLETLLEQEPEDTSRARVAAWFSTHPLTSTRLLEARAEIAEARVENPEPPRLLLTSYPAFLRRIEALSEEP